jgi:isopenicillin N synthase-like dioxygenase
MYSVSSRPVDNFSNGTQLSLQTSQDKNTNHTNQNIISQIFTSTQSNGMLNTNMQTPANLPLKATAVLDIADIPLIDLESISEKSLMERQAIIKKFGDGLRDVGFVAVKANIDPSLIEKVNSIMKDYFAQKIEEKEKDIHDNFGSTGYTRNGGETAAGVKKADLKETYFIPPNFQRWPENLPEFKPVMQAYQAAMTQITAPLMEFVAEYLNEPTEETSTTMDSPNTLLRLLYYPAPKPTDDPEAVWGAPHEDLNALTIMPRSTIPGLQMLTKDGKWKSVIVPPGYLIVNTGEQLQMKTAGLIKATRHQVLNPGGEYARAERYTSILFASWSDDFSLKPYESCIRKVTAGMSEEAKSAYLQQYPSVEVSVKDNLESRLIEQKFIMNPTEERVKDLLSKGLLRQPPEYLVNLYKHLF